MNKVFTKKSQSGKDIAISFEPRMTIAVEGKIQSAKNQKIEKVAVKGMGQHWIAGGLVVLTDLESAELIALRDAVKAEQERERLQAINNGKAEVIATGAVKLLKFDDEFGNVSWNLQYGDRHESINLAPNFKLGRDRDETLTFAIAWQLDMVEYQQVIAQAIEVTAEPKAEPKIASPIQKDYWETDPRYGFAE